MHAHFERGLALFDLGRHSAAAKEFSLALAENPEFVWAHINLAAALFNCGDVFRAEKSVAKAISLAPEVAHSYYLLSYVQQTVGNFRSAKQAILEAIRLEPTAKYFFRLAQIYDWREERNHVLDATASALKLDPCHVPSILLRGEKLVELGRHQEANELFALALRENPDYAEAHHAMGKLQLTAGDANAALQLLREARRLNPLQVNDKMAIAEAYGLNLPAFRTLNRYVVRWHLWPFFWKWIVAVVVTFLVCLAIGFTDLESHRRTGQDILESRWWIFCVLLANYLILPYTLARLARAAAMIVAKRDLDTSWLGLVFQPINLLWILFLHGFATLSAVGFAGVPELIAMIFAISTCYSFLSTTIQNSVTSLSGCLLLPLFILLLLTAVLGVSLVVYGGGLVGYVVLAGYFTTTYFCEKFARWTSSVRFLGIKGSDKLL